jgi:hypothetical protein
MKILKSTPQGIYVFDTQDPAKVEPFTNERNFQVQDALHHHHRQTDFEYLKKYFAPEHDIFKDFGRAFFSVIK